MYMCVCACMHMCLCAYVFVCVFVCVCMCAYAYIYVCMNVCGCACVGVRVLEFGGISKTIPGYDILNLSRYTGISPILYNNYKCNDNGRMVCL